LVLQPKKIGPALISQTPRAGTGDSVGRTRHHWCSTLFSYDSNLSMCGTALIRLLSPTDDRGIRPSSKETYDLNLTAVLLSIWSFCIQTVIFCTKNCTNLWVASIPTVAVFVEKNFNFSRMSMSICSSSGGTISILGNSTRHLRFQCTEVRKTPRVSMHWNEGLDDPTALQKWPRACRCAFWKSLFERPQTRLARKIESQNQSVQLDLRFETCRPIFQPFFWSGTVNLSGSFFVPAWHGNLFKGPRPLTPWKFP